MNRWEYLSTKFRLDELDTFQSSLNKFGEMGWDLVSVVPIETKSVGVFDSGSATSELVAIFKRPNQ